MPRTCFCVLADVLLSGLLRSDVLLRVLRSQVRLRRLFGRDMLLCGVLRSNMLLRGVLRCDVLMRNVLRGDVLRSVMMMVDRLGFCRIGNASTEHRGNCGDCRDQGLVHSWAPLDATSADVADDALVLCSCCHQDEQNDGIAIRFRKAPRAGRGR